MTDAAGVTDQAAARTERLAGELAGVLTQARQVVVMTGAGISAESGVPTFRDAQSGLWSRFRPEELATPEAFERSPETVWRWYEWRRERIASVHPNAGHHALARLAGFLAGREARFTLVTQNVDGLHQRAGSSPVIELHGNLNRQICSVTRRPLELPLEPAADAPLPPPSPYHSRGLARPDVVWFGEPLPTAALAAAVQATADCDLFFSIGTSALVEPAASLGRRAAARGAAVVEINPAATPLTPEARFVFREPAGEALPRIVAALEA